MDNKQIDELNRVTMEWLEAHPLDPDAFFRYVMSDEWRPREPFIYKADS